MRTSNPHQGRQYRLVLLVRGNVGKKQRYISKRLCCVTGHSLVATGAFARHPACLRTHAGTCGTSGASHALSGRRQSRPTAGRAPPTTCSPPSTRPRAVATAAEAAARRGLPRMSRPLAWPCTSTWRLARCSRILYCAQSCPGSQTRYGKVWMCVCVCDVASCLDVVYLCGLCQIFSPASSLCLSASL